MGKIKKKGLRKNGGGGKIEIFNNLGGYMYSYIFIFIVFSLSVFAHDMSEEEISSLREQANTAREKLRQKQQKTITLCETNSIFPFVFTMTEKEPPWKEKCDENTSSLPLAEFRNEYHSARDRKNDYYNHLTPEARTARSAREQARRAEQNFFHHKLRRQLGLNLNLKFIFYDYENQLTVYDDNGKIMSFSEGHKHIRAAIKRAIANKSEETINESELLSEYENIRSNLLTTGDVYHRLVRIPYEALLRTAEGLEEKYYKACEEDDDPQLKKAYQDFLESLTPCEKAIKEMFDARVASDTALAAYNDASNVHTEPSTSEVQYKSDKKSKSVR